MYPIFETDSSKCIPVLRGSEILPGISQQA
jgi:hypothetical protein